MKKDEPTFCQSHVSEIDVSEYPVREDTWASPVVPAVKNPPATSADTKDSGFDPRVGKIPWRKAGQPTPVFLPGESHGQSGLAGYHPQGHRELDMMEET